MADQLIDSFGRVVKDLRISLTDRCNLRCTYCMPEEGQNWFARDELLTDEEIIRLVNIAASRLGITMVRFTGGEPLLRKSLEHIIANTPVPTALTTNGLGLAHRAAALKAAGLDRVSISLDSIDADTYSSLTRRGRLDSVLAAIDAAIAANLQPVKINAVVMPGVNDGQRLVDLATFCMKKGVQLRLIEQMPLGPPEHWQRDIMITQDDILRQLSQHFHLSVAEEPRGSAPAQLWDARSVADPELVGKIGIIGSVTHAFCAECDRTRITSDGAIRNCLFATDETSIRDAMRAGASDDDIVALWKENTMAKKFRHGIDEVGFTQPVRNMSAIGG